MFGGSFDPVHNDHIELCRLMAETFSLDKVFVFPAACNPFKNGTQSEDFHRLNMCTLAFGDDAGIVVSDYEICNGGKSYTVDTLRYLYNKFSDSELFLIVGADAFLTLSDWYCADEIFSLAHILTIVRDSDSIIKLKEKAEEYKAFCGECSFVGTPVGDISSTKIRRLIAEGKDVSSYLPEKVYDYIKLNGLYGYGD